jgi:hypothetical protein
LWLTGGLAHWQASGLLSEGQAGWIAEVYGTPQELAEWRTDRGLQVLTNLATPLVGLAVLLLIALTTDGKAVLHGLIIE